jgi:pimeloyl-ACP methyl ester carboxylesterase
MASVETGMLNGAIPYLAVGDGPPLVMAMGLTATHEVPTGAERRMVLRSACRCPATSGCYVVNRRPGLRLGTSMSEIAAHLSTAIEEAFGGAVLLTGTSTGGSVALQLAVDRPDLVRACGRRIGPPARSARPGAAARAGAAHQGRGPPAAGWAH